MIETRTMTATQAEALATDYRAKHPEAVEWAAGYGAIEHTPLTQARVFAMCEALKERGLPCEASFFELMKALDRVASAGMWLVVHQTYARNVYLDGRDLAHDDFKPRPEGHTGGALNMVPAYAGYLGVNALTGITRSWVIGQGHTVAAIDSLNVLVDNMTPAHAERYGLSDDALTRYVNDFYSYRLNEAGEQESPLGSHVNVHTAGGMVEGGYLGFTELQYVHMPLPGERLVVFLSDGAFEEQRGSDWTPRWWRAEDCGAVTPIMIANGRRIDQRTTIAQHGGTEWLQEHLELNSFDPFTIDGRDPAAFAWAVFEMEARLEEFTGAMQRGEADYPVRLPYAIAEAPKGAGFFGEGENLAHNLPLGANPYIDPRAASEFNIGVRRLWVAPDELRSSIHLLSRHEASERPRERDHALMQRDVRVEHAPEPPYVAPPDDRLSPKHRQAASPMEAVDEAFAQLCAANPHLRPRVGNPDEMKSNRMLRTLEQLQFRVTDPEPGIPESLHGSVITALNEEAVASAGLGNKGGINIVVTYEAFAPKMLGIFRQEITFAAQLKAAGKPTGWLSVPLLLTSHTWENGKNEISHQDPTMAEALMAEPSDVSRVVFPPDANTAAATLMASYQEQGQYWTMVVPKSPVPLYFTQEECRDLLQFGAISLSWAGHESDKPSIILAAVGAYQLGQVLRASVRLGERGVAHSVVYVLEPARFRLARSAFEQQHLAPAAHRERLFPPHVPRRLFVTHTRPEALLGTIQPLHTGALTAGRGFINRGGTLDVDGMFFVNRTSWAHIVDQAAALLGLDREELLTSSECAALDGRLSPHGVVI
jgi:phosphoketolase